MNQVKMYFAEDNEDWVSIPEWVNFLIRFGYCWSRINHKGRRVALVSMPCSSPGAGLIALGALIGDLGEAQANDVATHNDLVFNYARQYLEYCKECTLSKCDPIIRRCGLVTGSTLASLPGCWSPLTQDSRDVVKIMNIYPKNSSRFPCEGCHKCD